MDGEVVRVERGEGGERGLLALPGPERLPGGGVRVREAVAGDLGFIDRLQKEHSKAVGWMPRGQLEGHIGKGHVLIAEAIKGCGVSGVGCGDSETEGLDAGSGSDALTLHPKPQTLHPRPASPVGYCIGVDKYFKREDVGIVYQMNVAPGRQRGLIGATLLQAMFDRWPYGVRLCCCWCAQDLAANKFWEAMGFVPLAFRAGGYGKTKAADLAKGVFKGRVHIFWQKAIRREDRDGRGKGFRGWWFPSQTGSGAIREDRVVLPIPPGVHWSEAKPAVLPGMAGVLSEVAAERETEAERLAPSSEEARAMRKREREARKKMRLEMKERVRTMAGSALRFGGVEADGGDCSDRATTGETPVPLKKKRKKAKRVALKNDPRLVAAARELRDRWLEKVADEPGLIEAGEGAKYNVARRLEAGTVTAAGLALVDEPRRLLEVRD